MARQSRPAVMPPFLLTRPAAQGDRSENAEYIYGKKRLREIDRRLNFLGGRIKRAVVVDPAASAGKSQVFFGATVDVEDEDGAAQTWHVVGEDEVDPAAGRVSWRSPLGRALLKKRAGDVTVYVRPDGAKIELTVTEVRYGT
jgi:transcription elongation factor GreB